MNKIPKSEFELRIQNLRKKMINDDADVFLIYGDEYRRENIRYVCNYWPIFERGILVVGLEKEPILLASPECQNVAREMSAWQDIRLVRDVSISYIPEDIDYTNTNFTTIKDVVGEVTNNKKNIKVKISGYDAMSVILHERIKSMLEGAIIENADKVLYDLRYIKSSNEVEMLKKAWEICDIAYKAALDADIIGLTEKQVVGIGEKAAYDAGAENVLFSILGSGERSNTVIGRPTDRIINKGDMIMYVTAVLHEGYIASVEWPFVAGGKPSQKQNELIYHLVKAEDIGVKSIKKGVSQGSVVRKIRRYFQDNDLEKYDIYAPIHGNGLAEAESPYPNENTNEEFLPGVGINFDVSLFEIPGVGSNRIEEGFIVDKDGSLIILSKLISSLRMEYLENYK